MQAFVVSFIALCFIGIIAAIIKNNRTPKKGEDHEHL